MSNSRAVPVAAIAMILAASAACGAAPGGAPPSSSAAAPDSIVLERGPCFGACPMYRLVLEGNGTVRFLARGDSTARTGTVAPDAVAGLVADAEEAGFFVLPARIMDDPALCSRMATDHPGVQLAIFQPGSVKAVDHYTGCHGQGESSGLPPALVRLAALEARVDSVAGVSRWIVPRGR